MEYGLLGVVPVIILLGMAVWTRKCTSSMIMGCLAGCIILGGGGFLTTFVDMIYVTGCDADTVWILVLLSLIGPVVALLAKSGGPEALSKLAAKKVKSEKSLFLWSWLLAVVLFIEDMMRSAVLGQLSPLYDKQKVPRASLAYFIDATSTTITSLIPITGWAVFFQGIFADFEELKGYGSGFDIYVKTIPYNFYAIAALLVCFGFTMGWVPKLGGMKKAYILAKEEGILYSDESAKLNPPVEHNRNVDSVDKKGLGILIFGIMLLTAVTIASEVLYGFIVCLMVLPVVLLLVKKATWKELMETSMQGVRNTAEMVVICFFVYFFKNVITELQLPQYVIETCGPFLSAQMFPGVTFLACGILAFCSGSTWGVTIVYATIAVPMCIAIGADPVIVLAAILSGEAFGAHICFYCDYTVYASTCARINNIEHAFTQVPYGIIGGVIAAIGFFITGFAVV